MAYLTLYSPFQLFSFGRGAGAAVAQGSGAPAPASQAPVSVSAFLALSFNIFVNSVPSLPRAINLNPSMVRKIV